VTYKLMERAIISGATSGIGHAIAVRLAERGAIVGLVGRNMAAADSIAAGIRASGRTAFVAQADVADVNSLSVAVQRFVQEFGGIDTVVASAGIALTGTVTDMTTDDWNRVLATNLSGTFHLARLTIPELLKTRGTFTAISSDAGVQGASGYAAYCASKHGINGLIKCLALDHGKDGVRCNAVSPAFVETPMADELLKTATATEVDYFKRMIPIGRFGLPEEVAAAVAHLSSREASFVNGSIYAIDGGTTAGFYSAPG
jgi:meso-butanediol dehydrogenase / (S,S)-butanediol dehydrogenase / diacetyl reductase